jgi:uncharacterized protein (TIGR02145 family)
MKSVYCLIAFFTAISLLNLQAQDYLISFTATSANTPIDSIKVENLIQRTSVTINGTDILHLVKSITGIDNYRHVSDNGITFYPNPMNDMLRMQFSLPDGGETIICLFDNTGRQIACTENFLMKGRHIFTIQGIKKGIWFISVKSDKFSAGGKFISLGSGGSEIMIRHEQTDPVIFNSPGSKGQTEEVMMVYNTGETLVYTSYSANNSAVVGDSPSGSKTITFAFVPCTDADGTNYPVVQIGTQFWMAKNLATIHYKDGTSVPHVMDKETWSGLTTGAYCFYDINATNLEIYGRLYNWFAVNNKSSLCPAGWHIPTNGEWLTLCEYAGGVTNAGGNLKSTILWNSPNTNATNKFGFSALPGGYRNKDGNYMYLKEQGNWWTATESGELYSYGRTMQFNHDYASSTQYNKLLGFSVRCIKD